MTAEFASRLRRIPKKALAAVAATTALVFLLLYMRGTIGGRRIAPGSVPLPENPAAPGVSVVPVERRKVEDVIEWPGTVASRTVASVAPKLMARVINVRVNLGSIVAAGDVLITLDGRDVRAQVEQARAALAAAQAQAARAESDQRRVRTLFEKEAATQQDLDAVNARATAARAQVAQARDALTAAKVTLSETTVRAPFDGIIAQRLVDPGDMAVPGQPLVVIQDPAQLRLETRIAERCAGLLAIGMEIPVRFETPRRDVTARIEEIAPMADPRSRTFLVKAALSPAPGLRPGIFGALRTSCGTHIALLIPATAVTRIGQLETARVMIDGAARMRNLKTGKTYGDRVEVLSGLRAGELVLTGG